MAKAWLVLGSPLDMVVVEREMSCDRAGKWYVSTHNPASAPRYTTGDGILFWCQSDGLRHAVNLLTAHKNRIEERTARMVAHITNDVCEADGAIVLGAEHETT